MVNPEHRLGAIMLADIAGYSALMERNETLTFSRLQVLRKDITQPMVAEHGGRIIKTTGDGFLAEFPSAISALKCGIAIQRANVPAQEQHAEAERFHLRIGINLGDIIIDGDDISGDGVNIAARLEPMAPLDGLCVSAAVREQIREDLGVVFEDLGDRTVKNLSRPVRAYRVDLTGKAPKLTTAKKKPGLSRRALALAAALVLGVGVAVTVAPPASLPFLRGAVARPADAGPLSIVVLPFSNLTGDASQSYVADGLTASVTADLARIRDAFIVSATSAFAFKDNTLTAKQLGEKLGVRFVLQGNVQRSGTMLRINAQLADTSNNAQLWSESFEGDSADLFSLQDKVTRRIAASMDRELLIRAASASEKRGGNPSVTDLMLRARAMAIRPLELANWKQAEQYYRQALAIEPQLSAATSGLALSLAVQATSFPNPDAEANSKLNEAILLAKRLVAGNTADSATYYVLMQDAMKRQDWYAAMRAAETQMALEPNSIFGYNNTATICMLTGDSKRALELLKKVVDMDPKNVIDFVIHGLVNSELMAGHLDKALEWQLRLQTANPHRSAQDPTLAAIYALRGNMDQAIAARKAVLQVSPQMSVTMHKAQYKVDNTPQVFQQYYQKTIAAGMRKAGFPEK